MFDPAFFDPVRHFSAFAALERAFATRNLAVFLDVDGTLLEIALRPDAVSVSTRLRELIERLALRNDRALALVSGRQLEDLDRLFAPLVLPAAGLHGLERRDAAGRIHRIDCSDDLLLVRRFLSDNAYAGLLIEDKQSALVVHYRERPDLEEESRTLAQGAVASLEPEHAARWHVVPGKMSFEIRVSNVTKRDAIATFLAEPPFAGRTPVFFGDDVSDEEGFAYVNGIGGWSVHIGTTGETIARASLPGPSAVLQVLASLLDSGATGDAQAGRIS